MKRIALVAIAVLALAGVWTTTATSESTQHSTPREPHSHAPPHNLTPARCTIEGFRPFSAAVWRLGAWERGKPPARVLEARTASLACAAPHHRAAMKRTWRRDAAAYFAHRRRELLRPFVYPDGSRWAVPYPIATCESGDPGAGIYGNYYVGPYGAYGLILEAEWMSPIEQDRIAGQLYREQGEGPWAPFEGECALR